MQTGLEKNLFGNHPVSLAAPEARTPPPAFASDPIIGVSSTSLSQDGMNEGSSTPSVTEIMEIEGPGSAGNFVKNSSPPAVRLL